MLEMRPSWERRSSPLRDSTRRHPPPHRRRLASEIIAREEPYPAKTIFLLRSPVFVFGPFYRSTGQPYCQQAIMYSCHTCYACFVEYLQSKNPTELLRFLGARRSDPMGGGVP